MQTMIVANTAIMALDHYPQSAAWDRVQLVSNFIFTSIYIIEMAGKLVALGPYGYFSDAYNCLDGFLVITSYEHTARLITVSFNLLSP